MARSFHSANGPPLLEGGELLFELVEVHQPFGGLLVVADSHPLQLSRLLKPGLRLPLRIAAPPSRFSPTIQSRPLVNSSGSLIIPRTDLHALVLSLPADTKCGSCTPYPSCST